jgi:CheY-like chemotaxis protein/phosphoribosyl 1,2-cyclic phosphodiesterase
MRVKFWGTRGSIPTPGPSTLKYGGNTPCIEVRTDDGTLIILDCGSGARELGETLMKEGRPIVAHLLLSHTHWDHTQGLTAFAPAFVAGNSFTIYGAPGVNQTLKEVLASQMAYTYFPITLERMGSELTFREIGEGAFNIGDIWIATRFLNHTVLTVSYRIKAGDATIVYATDHEPYYPVLHRNHPPGAPKEGYGIRSTAEVVHAGDRQHIHFLYGADLLIHDAQFTEAEYKIMRNWGHSPAEYATDVAIAAQVKRLALYHHDPVHNDRFLETLEQHCQGRAAAQGSSLIVFAAMEGQEIDLPEQAGGQVVTRTPQMSQVHLRHKPRILIADNDESVVKVIHNCLQADDYEIMIAFDGEEALNIARQHHPDLVLLDIRMPKKNGYEVARALQSDPATQDIVIALVTVQTEEDDMVRGFEVGVADYITKPIHPAMLRTRVRSLLLRARAPEEGANSN